jgi:hypothetical protein
MTDYRTLENRGLYFNALYEMNLLNGTMPGMVYLYLPGLKHALGWDDETALWFAFLNGMTQNMLTSLRLFEKLPEPPRSASEMNAFKEWFDAEWPRLQFDTDRRYAKKETPAAIWSYRKMVSQQGHRKTPTHLLGVTQAVALNDHDWDNLWAIASSIHSFGRLSAFSYLEYVSIAGYGAQPDTLLFDDKSGSKSHRNGMLFLMGQDKLVDDKRTGQLASEMDKASFKKMCAWLQENADIWQAIFNERQRRASNSSLMATNFTFESQLCQFKNSFFGRRYPGVYADMAWERLKWYKANVGQDRNCRLIADIYHTLPEWLQYGDNSLPLKARAAMFPSTGIPYRAEHFLT